MKSRSCLICTEPVQVNRDDPEKEKLFARSPEDYEQGMRYYREQVTKNEERIKQARQR